MHFEIFFFFLLCWLLCFIFPNLYTHICIKILTWSREKLAVSKINLSKALKTNITANKNVKNIISQVYVIYLYSYNGLCKVIYHNFNKLLTISIEPIQYFYCFSLGTYFYRSITHYRLHLRASLTFKKANTYSVYSNAFRK